MDIWLNVFGPLFSWPLTLSPSRTLKKWILACPGEVQPFNFCLTSGAVASFTQLIKFISQLACVSPLPLANEHGSFFRQENGIMFTAGSVGWHYWLYRLTLVCYVCQVAVDTRLIHGCYIDRVLVKYHSDVEQVSIWTIGRYVVGHVSARCQLLYQPTVLVTLLSVIYRGLLVDYQWSIIVVLQ